MPTRLVGVLREHEIERDVGATQASGGVDARREPKADGARVDGRRVDARAAHERLQPRAACRGESLQPGRGERAVLVDERDDVRDRRQRDEIEVPANGRCSRPSSASPSLWTTPVPHSSGNG